MSRIYSGNPDRPMRLSPLLALRAAVRTGIERHIPIPTLIRHRMRTLRAFRRGPSDMARYVACMRHLLQERPCDISAERAAWLSYAVWHVARRSYAPVFRRSRQWLIDALRPRGLEHLDVVREAGTGCVLAGCHVGMFAWVGPILWGMGYPTTFAARQHMAAETAYLALQDGLADRRLPFGEVGQGTVQLKKLHEMITGGAWLRHTADVADPERGIPGRIFGRTLQVVRAPWVLAQMTGAPIVPVVVPLGDDLQPRLHVGEPICVEKAGRSAATERALQQYLDFTADVVGDAVWNFHPRVWATWFADEPS